MKNKFLKGALALLIFAGFNFANLVAGGKHSSSISDGGYTSESYGYDSDNPGRQLRRKPTLTPQETVNALTKPVSRSKKAGGGGTDAYSTTATCGSSDSTNPIPPSGPMPDEFGQKPGWRELQAKNYLKGPLAE